MTFFITNPEWRVTVKAKYALQYWAPVAESLFSVRSGKLPLDQSSLKLMILGAHISNVCDVSAC
eukprot:CAMPEP_0203692398 /NCGR_PEP_ID=MMETSP0091-20130426/4566_1 /ASSEMBLY_ACC=CAM_ASM_001089 /TAXON_ID=426623 /ORGANISM="Chaetoceros affinis, Strain CCMP159" /LENGTH=63 /DNA_ID=CAMNT_0050563199 /DNA_START=900 /DNA_END=1088 /DNA_ORIENTATION=+